MASGVRYIVALEGMGSQQRADAASAVARHLDGATSEAVRTGLTTKGYYETTYLGEPVRITEVHWADILNNGATGGFPEWIDERVEALEWKVGREGRGEWVVETIRAIRAVISRAIKVWFLGHKLRRWLVDERLRDVDVYATDDITRRRAAGHFRAVLNDIWNRHAGDHPPRITILAHSLGSVLSFDQLLDAHRITDRAPWADAVDAFITFGSPVDKFLTVWWKRYQHLLDATWLTRTATPIKRYSYCDEQDPFGGELEMSDDAAAVKPVFEPCEDRLFVRDWMPLGAHLSYFDDDELWKRVLPLAVGRPLDAAPAVNWFRTGTYVIVLLISYALVPLLGVLLSATTAWAAATSGGLPRIALGVATAGLLFFFGRICYLLVQWRQVLSNRRTVRLGKGLPVRRRLGRGVNAVIRVSPAFWAALLVFAWPLAWGAWWTWFQITAVLFSILILVAFLTTKQDSPHLDFERWAADD